MKLTPQTNEELIKSVEGACPDFQFIPEHEKYVMALYCAGVSEAGIASVTGRTLGGIDAVIDRYKQFTSQLPDAVKGALSAKTLYNSLPTYVSVITDKDKIAKLTPLDAIKCATAVIELTRLSLNLAREMADAQSAFKGMEGLGEFTKRLNNKEEA